MSRCNFCRKKSSIQLKCNYCSNEHCMVCRFQDIHKCENINIMKCNKQKELEKTLMDQKTVSNKVIKIKFCKFIIIY